MVNSTETDEKTSRGAFIVIEGCDRSGKSTQCARLVEKLTKSGVRAELICFPDRSTPIGSIINDYLTKDVQIADQVIHLLFSANRWERSEELNTLINNGVTVIADRYSYSGVAYSAAKKVKGVSLQWFKNPDEGLPKPDAVFYLHLEPEVVASRKGFGEERYEVPQFQKDVVECFNQLNDGSWQVIDADKTLGDLTVELYSQVTKIVDQCKNRQLDVMW